jgi:hypothetical protein|tara:strand:+ start:1729 stop:1968 length:240 start_codon:yes stop_codon:yes gene_type:complete
MFKEKDKIDFIGKYHPYPKEAPKSWRMARMKELRKEVQAKRLEEKRQWGLMEYHAKSWGLLAVYLIAFAVVVMAMKELF